MDNIIIKNGTIVQKNKTIKADMLIVGNKIAKIGKVDSDQNATIIDADGKYILAGFVDMHCHLREPGQEYKETIASGTLSAVKGGFTSVCCMPNTTPPIDDVPSVQFVLSQAKKANNCRVFPIAAITKGQKGAEITEFNALKNAGAVALSDDGKCVLDANVMRLALEYAQTVGIKIISHCEEPTLALGGVVNEGYASTISGLKPISRASEEIMVAREIILAQTLNTSVHIAHVSTSGSVALIREAKARGVKVTCETCPHYFAATDDEILNYNTNAKINPPLRGESDVAAVIEGIIDGTIDVIATDHAPHHIDEKNIEFNNAPFGTVGFETAFAISYTHLVRPRHIDIITLSKLLSANPAGILQLPIGNAVLVEGSIADIAVVDLNAQYTINSAELISKSKNSVFDGFNVFGKVTNTIVDGVEIKC